MLAQGGDPLEPPAQGAPPPETPRPPRFARAAFFFHV
jgi:hypothetical protein